MGKKGGLKPKAKPEAKAAQSKAAPAPAASPAEPPRSWQETLENNSVLKEQEEKKAAERQKKADEAARKAQKQVENKEYWEKEQKKQERKQAVDDRKWQKEVDKAKAQAFKEGVKEAVTEDDGWTYYVLIDPKAKTWQECSDIYYCTLCSKNLNDGNLQAHLDSEAHRKKVAWLCPDAKAAAPSPFPAAAASSSSADAPPPRPAMPPPAADWAVRGPGRLEEWQELDEKMGVIRCIPCGKVCDDSHLGSDDHKRRLESWLEAKRLEEAGYPAPELPYLAWVPNVGTSERWMKCLLCNKFVQDDWSHVGTFSDPKGSREHSKNLRNCLPSSQWYRENVTQLREQYHPGSTTCPSLRVAQAGGYPAGRGCPPCAPSASAMPPAARAPATPAPWGKAAGPPAAAAWGPPPGQPRAAAPPRPADPAPPARPMGPPVTSQAAAPAAQPLPEGWEERQFNGKTFYKNRDGQTVLERPVEQAPKSESDDDGLVDV